MGIQILCGEDEIAITTEWFKAFQSGCGSHSKPLQL